MKRLLRFLFIATTLLVLSCSKKCDDTVLSGKIDDLENRVSKLEQMCQQMNTNISSLQKIVDALQDNLSVTKVEQMTDGYIIHFSDGSAATIKNGKDSGTIPIIGVKLDVDGSYYWTLNGEWLTDEKGNKVRAQGNDGKDGVDGKDGNDGIDGITPRLKIEDGRWMISMDEGKTWTSIGQATGTDGKDGTNGIFKSVTEDDDNVYFTLDDDSVITISKGDNSKFAIAFDATDVTILNGNESKTIFYSIVDATAKTVVKAIAQDGWKAKVNAISADKGTITITAPNPIIESEVLVFANDGSYRTIMASLNCVQGQIIVADNSYDVGVEGGIIKVNLKTNINYTVDIPDNAKSWISIIDTRAIREETISFEISKNEGEPRFATITLRSEQGQSIQTIIVRQTSNAQIEIPDFAFRQYLINNFDSDKDGYISYAEAEDITTIDINSDNVESLKGIEYFTNLTHLTAVPKNDGWEATGVGGAGDSGYWRDSGYKLNGTRVSGKIAELDLSHNVNLSHLDCSGNIIKELDLSNNINLNHIDASFNLDLSTIVFPLNNRIYELKLTATSIETIEVLNMPDLQSLSINTGLGIHQIDLSNNSKLKYLNVQGNKLNNIDVSHNSMLETLICSINSLQTLDVSNNPRLSDLHFAFNNIKSIDVSHNTSLTQLSFQNNNLSDIDVSMLHDLQFIHFGNYQKASDGSIICNKITHIDLSNNTKLEDLFATLI